MRLQQIPLPLCPTEPTRREAAMTAHHLSRAIPELSDFLLEIRREVDYALTTGTAPLHRAKPYPQGYCLEITRAVFLVLKTYPLARSRHPGARAMHAYATRGGSVRHVWGALRGRYFQNAMQAGGLYIDVANDTVDVNKPKVEILPMAESGLEALRDPAHFADIAGRYWNASLYANHALPDLAPIFPMIGVAPGQTPQLHSPNNYMTALVRRSDFRLAETWLAEGPAPPDNVVAALRASSPGEIRGDDAKTGRMAALAACADARLHDLAADIDWLRLRLADHGRISRHRG